ncbi:MAG: hypothetical protein K0S15_2412, partial [Solirubrobacterales bacterium]|nr:hypothetical protein [Solirubrobacterales bacterium]
AHLDVPPTPLVTWAALVTLDSSTGEGANDLRVGY